MERPVDVKAKKAKSYLRLQAAIRRRLRDLNPVTYGLPDLMALDPENDGRDKFDPSLIADQRQAIKDFCEKAVKWVEKDGTRRKVRMIPEQIRFVADLFYLRVKKAIVWKSRGGGGSFAAAVLVWLFLVYRRKSFLNIAGSGEQAQAVYKYVKSFWKRFPKLKSKILASEPLVTETRLVGDVILKCVPASEKQVRSKHMPGLIADESCQEREDADKFIKAAINGAMSEVDHVIVLVSTFHVPTGIFQETWDHAEKKGYTKYKWTIFDTMSKCEVDIDCAECPLTWRRNEEKGDGTVHEVLTGCNGTARESDGWVSRDHVLLIQEENAGDESMEVEYGGVRPRFKLMVYDPDKVELARVDQVIQLPAPPLPRSHAQILSPSGIPLQVLSEDPVKLVAGIDWGFSGMMAIVLMALVDLRIWVLDMKTYQGQLEEVVAEDLRTWQTLHGRRIKVRADGSHPMSNARLANEFEVRAVFFAQWKEWGIRNTNRWLNKGRLLIPRRLSLLTDQMKMMKRSASGNVVKRNDHCPDALMCGTCEFPWERHFGDNSQNGEGDVSVTTFGRGGAQEVA